MFNISFKVSGSKLADTLTRLHSVIQAAYEVTPVGQEAASAESQANGAPLTAKGKPVKVRRHTRNWRGPRSRDAGPSDQDRAIAIIRQFGVPPFKTKDFLAQCNASDVSTPTAYRALKLEREAGHLSRVEPGTYQRTPSSFSASLGLKQQA